MLFGIIHSLQHSKRWLNLFSLCSVCPGWRWFSPAPWISICIRTTRSSAPWRLKVVSGFFFFFFQDDSVSTPIFHGSEFSYSFVFVRPSCKSGDVSLQTRRAAPPFPTCSRISTSHWVNWKAVFHFFSFCAGEIKFLRERGKSCWGRVVYFFLPLLFLSVGVRVSTEVVNNNDWRVCDVFALLSILLFLLLLLLLCFP